jgi:DNA-binding protein HU-beta
MTKAEIVSQIATNTGLEKAVVSETIESFFSTVKSNMASGNSIYFRGFGSFILKNRAKKMARNITKNLSMTVEAHTVPAFKPAKPFVNDVRKKVRPQAKKKRASSKKA